MTGRARGRFGRLSESQRDSLADYLAARNEYLEASRTHNELLMGELENPSRSSDRQIRKFESTVLGPARARMRERQITLLSEAVDAEALAELVPDLLRGLSRSVSIPLLFAALNIDADRAEELVEKSAGLVRRVGPHGVSP